MGIKNFFVKMKPAKFGDHGLKNLLKYLKDEQRHLDGIVNFKKLSNAEEFFNKTFLAVQHHEAKRKFHGVAGRGIKSYADSYIFTIPVDFFEKVNNKETLTKITQNLLKKFYNTFKAEWERENKKEIHLINEKITKLKEELEKEEVEYKKEKILEKIKLLEEKKKMEFISLKDFIDNIFINVHTNKHIHFNVVIPRVYKTKNGYLSNRITNRKTFISKIKQQWNLIMLEELNINYKDYKPREKYKKNFKNIYIKKLIDENNKVLEEIEKKEEELKKLEELLELKRSEIKKYTEKILQENNRKEEIIKAFQLMIRYYKSIAEKIQKKQLKGLLKDYNKIKEKIKIVKELTTSQHLKNIAEEVENNINKWQSQGLGL